MPTHHHGRHEHGQNFLNDRKVIASIVDLVAETDGPILEIGPGSGVLTRELVKLGRDLTVVEIDHHLAKRLQSTLPANVDVVHADFLTHRLPSTPHVIVGNLPFHLTTAILRRILHAPGWTDAILLVQWEVARRRAGVGNSTMMTAQWAPWFEFSLAGRVPARAFTPRPGVDGGLLTIHRREEPAISGSERRRFQGFVHRIFTGRGRGLAQILVRNTTVQNMRQARAILSRHALRDNDLPGAVQPAAWPDLFKSTGLSPPRHGGNRR